jgi:hypothetical protein
MPKHTTMTTGRASLCALGEYLRRHCFFAPLREQVQVPQKTVRHRPIDKVLDGLLGILCGAKTIAQSRVGTVAPGRVGGAGRDPVAAGLDGQCPFLTPSPARNAASGKLFGALLRACAGGLFALKAGSWG